MKANTLVLFLLGFSLPAIAGTTGGHARQARNTAKDRAAPQEIVVRCDGYRPGQSGIKADAYWKLKAAATEKWAKSKYQDDSALAEGTRQMNALADPELTPALLDLFTSNETLRYYGGYAPEHGGYHPKDGRLGGMNLILLQRRRTASGVTLPVAAIVTVTWDPETFQLRLKEGNDAVRVHTALHGGDDAGNRGDIGLSYAVTTHQDAVHITPGHYFVADGKRLKDAPSEAHVTMDCLGCHAGENGMTHHRFPPRVPLRNEADYAKYLQQDDHDAKTFLAELEKAIQAKKLEAGRARELMARAEQQLKNPRSLISETWIKALKKRCEDLQYGPKPAR